MTRCAHLRDGYGLQCTRPEHNDRGHTYDAGSGIPDRHQRTPNGDES